MTAPIGLLAFAFTVGILGPRWLSRASWPQRAPGLGIVAWQAVTGSVMLSLTLAGASLAVPELPASRGLAEFMQACSVAVRDHYSTPGGAILSVAGGALATLLVVRFACAILTGAARGRSERAHQRDMLALVAHPHTVFDVAVVDHDSPAVYCLPGRHKQVVVTSAALTALTSDQLEQVLAHERAHIRSRHHLVLLLADALCVTFWRRGPFVTARRSIGDLIEMHADDAARDGGRRDLAAALVVLAGGARPAGALGASGGSALVRVRRLTALNEPLERHQRIGLVAVVLFASLAPIVIALSPAAAAVLVDYCPVVFSS